MQRGGAAPHQSKQWAAFAIECTCPFSFASALRRTAGYWTLRGGARLDSCGVVGITACSGEGLHVTIARRSVFASNVCEARVVFMFATGTYI